MRQFHFQKALILTVSVCIPFVSVQAQTSQYGGYQSTLSSDDSGTYQQMPTYTYDPALDPKNLPKPPKPETTHSDKDLHTKGGMDLGVQVSGYKYEEPSLGVELSGPKFGMHALFTSAFHNEWFMQGDIRGAFGFSDYKGSGTQSGNLEYLWDIRALVGKDIVFNDFSVSPFTGFGFRYLYSDDRGVSSTGANGYQRENMLYYLPIGSEERFRVGDGARIAVNAEYDFVISGEQTSQLSDALAGAPDIKNTQKSGYGFRGHVMWEQDQWAAGPFVNYWHIEQSDTTCASGTTIGFCGYEPTNHTIEGGVEFRYHIY